MKEKPLEIKKIEKELMDYFTPRLPELEPNEIGRKILILIEYYKTIEKTAEALGVVEDWLGYYVGHLSLNPPFKSKKKMNYNGN